MSDTPALPDSLLLTPVEARVLGCLVEKEATTPDQYPLTENAVLMACNQKTSRDPVMDLDAGEVGHALRRMEPRGLLRSVHGARAQRYEHRLDRAYSLTRQQQALLAALLLRGPQTAAELASRAERLAEFPDPDAVHHALERLCERALVLRLPRAAGQREERYAHLLCGPVDPALLATSAAERSSPRAGTGIDLLARIEALEARVAALEALRGDP